MKVLFVIGTRPEAIKLAPVVLECQQRKDIETVVCSTGQHKELLDSAFEQWHLVPDIELAVMEPRQGLNQLVSKLLQQLDKVLSEVNPDYVVVQGDTSSCLSGALAAFQRKIPVFHVEAGLRTYDKTAPFPEELNRQLVSRIADVHFAPTEKNKVALLKEGIPESDIVVTGNTVIDALLMSVAKELELSGPVAPAKRLILVTSHRRENFGDGFNSICQGIRQLAEMNPSCEFLYPVHLNPNVQKPVFKILGKVKNIHLIKPAPYPEFIWLMNRCELMITDSGGVQEEGPSFKKPIIVTRETTERPEAVDAGAVLLVGSNQEKLVEIVHKLLSDPAARENFIVDKNPYGDGQASTRIIDILISNFCKNN